MREFIVRQSWCSVLGLLLAPLPALAGSSLMPVGPVIGDGQSPSTLQILTDQQNARFKIKPSAGKLASAPTPGVGGATFSWVPPAVDAITTIDLEVSVRGASKETFTASVTVVPPWSASFDMTFDPPEVPVGQTASVRVRPTAGSPQKPAKRTLRAVVSEGKISALVPSGDGSYVATYTPPARTDKPLQALVAVVDAAAPTTSLAVASIPVTLEKNITLDAPADSTNLFAYAGREVGPNKATPTGKVAFDVALHPAYKSGTLTSVAPDGTRTDTNSEVPVTADPSLVFAPLANRGPAKATLPVTIGCVVSTGQSCPLGDVTLTPSGGSLGTPRTLSDRAIRVDWTLPESGEASLRAEMGNAAASMRVDVVPGFADVSLASSPPVLEGTAQDFTLTARVKDETGTALVGRTPKISAENATGIGRTKDNGDGTYSAKYRLAGNKSWAIAMAYPEIASTGLPPRRLLAWPVRPLIPADGATTSTIVLVVEDDLGLPVPGVELSLRVPVGDGAVKPKVTTNDHGLATVTYTAGNKGGMTTIIAEGAGLSTAVGVWQAPAGSAVPALATVGSPSELAAQSRWQTAVPALVIEQRATVAAAPTTPAVAVPTTTTTAPVTPAAPAVANPASPSAVAVGSAPSTLTPPPPPSSAARARVRGTFVNAPFQYAAVLSGDSESVAPEASFSVPFMFGAVGTEVQAEGWLGRNRVLGGDVRARFGGYRLAVGNERYTRGLWEIQADIRLRSKDWGSFSTWQSLGFIRTAQLIAGYADERKTEASFSDAGFYGIRVAGAFDVEIRDFLGRGELSVAFAPPLGVLIRTDFNADIPLPAPVHLNVGLGLEYVLRSVTLEEDAVMAIGQRGMDLRLGVVVPFR